MLQLQLRSDAANQRADIRLTRMYQRTSMSSAWSLQYASPFRQKAAKQRRHRSVQARSPDTRIGSEMRAQIADVFPNPTLITSQNTHMIS
jgi:hypothetical protein